MKTLKKYTFMLLALVLAFGIPAACEGPAGPQGPQGPQGEIGPIGPAGEDGSVIYAGKGAPPADLGKIGDYYLNTNTGELYGPKDEKGWGEPVIVLMGEDGKDGEDREDGSRIYAGNGPPDASLGKVGDYYLDKSDYDLYGPKTKNGWGNPINLRGPRGPAGPAGEDGSLIYAGKGAPPADVGKIGDYYLNTNTGEFYGPKDKNGWGEPIIVLMGPRGPEGPAGEDGSQIYAGNGPPDASLGKVGDYYLDKTNYDLYGPKTDSGWGTPLHLKGRQRQCQRDTLYLSRV